MMVKRERKGEKEEWAREKFSPRFSARRKASLGLAQNVDCAWLWSRAGVVGPVNEKEAAGEEEREASEVGERYHRCRRAPKNPHI